MSGTRIWAAVPVKSLLRAKQRLAPALGPEQRRWLVLAMLGRVLNALAQTRSLCGTLVISPDTEVLAAAARAGATGIPQQGDIGLSASADQAARVAERHFGATAIMIVPADIASATHEDFEVVIAAHAGAGCTLARAHDGGTNTILLSPPCVMEFRFGPDSANIHANAARALGLRARILDVPALSRDVDEPGDLAWIGCVGS